jgi:phosphosulfolactate synthase
MLTELPDIPKRTEKPRNTGLTMVMDKGLSVNEAANLVDSSGHLIDFIKLGFGTSLFTNRVDEKILHYKKNGINVYLGGTLFEAFLIRNKLDDYLKLIEKLKIDTIEISDGSIQIDHNLKCDYINKLSKNFRVISEVGSKEAGVKIEHCRWVEMMKTELEAGADKVIAEARESGNVGIYFADGSVDDELINDILNQVSFDDIIWETPLKSQQTWFIKKFGANVNLGNIPPTEVIPLETLRTGLRGDTFKLFLQLNQSY